MLKRVAVSVLVALALAASALAQEKPSTEKDKPAKKAETVQRVPQPPPQPVNMQIDLTITDQRDGGSPIVKTVSLITADQNWGRIRTQGSIGPSREGVILNVDARPVLVRDGRARVDLTFDYRPADPAQGPTSASNTLNINESLAVVLESGKSMLISQSADPVGDRKVKVEAKMTILK